MKIDPEFHSLIPQLSDEEFNQLEANIVADGEVRDPIIVWKDHDIIVDGHNRWAILEEHPEIPYHVYEKEFGSREDVIVWMCCNQLGRRNLTDAQRSILIGKAYEARKTILPYSARDENGHYLKAEDHLATKSIMAKEYGTTPSEIERSGRFVRGLDEIEKVYPGTISRINSGDLEVTKKDVMSLTSMDKEDKENAIKDIVNGRRISKTLDSSPMVSAPEHQSEYNVEDFRSELERKIDSLDKSLELTCILTHKDFLKSEEGKEALRDTLLGMTKIIKKYMAYC